MQETNLGAAQPHRNSRPSKTASKFSSSTRIRNVAAFLLIAVILALAWEGYKRIGAATGNLIPFTNLKLPIRSDDTSMPHLWDIFATLLRPAQRGGRDILLVILIRAALFTWRMALAGFALGGLVGFGMAVAFVQSRFLERGLMPYVVASQTVPLLAIAPMVVIWGSRLSWPPWLSVAVLTAILTFFPVTINTLRGMQSPKAMAVELMRSYAASNSQVLWKLRLPAALPHLFAALKMAATASIIGAIIGELPSGIPYGLGRALLNFSYFYITGPERLYATVLISALLGIGFVMLVSLVEHLVMAGRLRPEI